MNAQQPPNLQQIIDNAVGEREVHRALEWHPWVVMELVTRNPSFVVSEFSLGGEYKTDFVVADCFSGGWELHFVELESPAIAPFNAKGDYGPALNHAAGQIRKWKSFEQRHDKRPSLMDGLRRAIIRKDLSWASGREPLDTAGSKMTDPESMILFKYHIIIGRRTHLAGDLMRRKAGLQTTDGFELITYDRVLNEYFRQRGDPIFEGTVRPPGQCLG